MDVKKNNNGKELDESIYTHLQSLMKSINAYFNYWTPRLWRQDDKLSIGATVDYLVTNAHDNKSNLYYDVTGRCDFKITKPKKKGKQIFSRLIGEV